jgi:hypothetical protein
MVSSPAKTVAAYLASLSPERRSEIAAIRKTIRANLPPGYRETMQYGMISYVVPLGANPDTYNGQPLAVVSLAAQKHHGALYLMGIYCDPAEAKWFEAAYRKTGKRMDIGKSCVRFRTLDDLPLDLIGAAVARMPADRFVALYEKSRRPAGARARGKGSRVNAPLASHRR